VFKADETFRSLNILAWDNETGPFLPVMVSGD